MHYFYQSFTQEGGRSKSHRYWPKLGSKHNSATYGKFKVTTKFRTEYNSYATTGLKVKHLLSGQERTVWHLQYTDWPEQGCPEYVPGFLCERTCLIVNTFTNQCLKTPPTRTPIFFFFSSLLGADSICEEAHQHHAGYLKEP